jgi:hypothetical protein
MVDQTRMPYLLPDEHAFAVLEVRVRSRFEGQMELIFAPKDQLDARARKESRDPK